MHKAGLRFCPSVSQCVCQGSVRQSVNVCVSHQNFGLMTTTKGLNTSKRHSNNDNSEKIVHGVPEGG